jgi:hypothetical protein
MSVSTKDCPMSSTYKSHFISTVKKFQLQKRNGEAQTKLKIQGRALRIESKWLP